MRSHTPILSDQCDGRLCRSCPQLWRYFVTGVELRGKGDNATFLMDATEDHRPGVYVKLTRARWRRVARRWAGVAVPGCLTAAHLIHRPLHALGLIGPSPWGWVLIGYLSVLVSLAASFGVYRLVKWFPPRVPRDDPAGVARGLREDGRQVPPADGGQDDRAAARLRNGLGDGQRRAARRAGGPAQGGRLPAGETPDRAGQGGRLPAGHHRSAGRMALDRRTGIRGHQPESGPAQDGHP